MALPFYGLGTVSIAADSTTVTGVGTLWSAVFARSGDKISIDNLEPVEIDDLTDATHLQLIAPWAGATKAGVGYKIIRKSPLRFAGGQAMADVTELLGRIDTKGIIWLLSDDAVDPTGYTAPEGQLFYQEATGSYWKMESGVWVASSGPLKGYGGSSTTSLTIANTTTKAFVATPPNLGYDGMRVRAASKANPNNFMEGVVSLTGAALTMTVDAIGGAGTYADWVFGIAGQPGNMTGSNNGSEFTDIIAVRNKIYAAPFDAEQFGNMVLNGGCEVSQRLGRVALTVVNGVGLKIADGIVANMTRTATLDLVAGQYDNASFAAPAGFQNCVLVHAVTGLASLTGGDRVSIEFPIEGYRVSRLDLGKSTAQAITISGWVFSLTAGTYTIAVHNDARTRDYLAPYTHNGTGWEFKTVTIPGDQTGTWLYTNGVGLRVIFAIAAGAGMITAPNAWGASSWIGATGQVNAMATDNANFAVTGVSVLAGSQAPSASRSQFLHRSFDHELTLCKRYYEKSYEYATIAGTASAAPGMEARGVGSNTVVSGQNYGSVPIITKRAAPTVSCWGYQGNPGSISNATPTDLAAGSATASLIGTSRFGVFNGSGGSVTTSNNLALFHWAAEAGLT